MNRYVLMAKSLSIPDSWILRTGFLLGIVISILFLIQLNTELGFTMVAAMSAMGIGHIAYLFSRSERRMTVPGMNETAAEVSIYLALALAVAMACLTIALHGLALDLIGISFVLIAFGLWFGWGERLIFMILAAIVFLFFICCSLVTYFEPAQEIVYPIISQLIKGEWILQRNLFGLFLGGVGCWALIRFWKVAAVTGELDQEKRFHDLWVQQVTSLMITVSVGENEGGENEGGENESPSKKSLISSEELSGRYLSRLQHLLYGKMSVSRFGFYLVVFAAAVVFAIMIYNRHDEAAWIAMQFFASVFLVVIPLVLFAARVPQTFSRLWVMGVAENRTSTARKILLIVLKRSLPWFAFVALALAVQSSTSWLNLTAMVYVLLAAIGFSGIALWVAARWYPFWARQSDFSIMIGLILMSLIVVGIATMTAAFDRWLFEEVTALRARVGHLGSIESMAIGIFVVVCIWSLCIFDAAKGLGRSFGLME